MVMHVKMRVRAVVVGLALSHNLAFRRRTRPIIAKTPPDQESRADRWRPARSAVIMQRESNDLR